MRSDVSNISQALIGTIYSVQTKLPSIEKLNNIAKLSGTQQKLKEIKELDLFQKTRKDNLEVMKADLVNELLSNVDTDGLTYSFLFLGQQYLALRKQKRKELKNIGRFTDIEKQEKQLDKDFLIEYQNLVESLPNSLKELGQMRLNYYKNVLERKATFDEYAKQEQKYFENIKYTMNTEQELISFFAKIDYLFFNLKICLLNNSAQVFSSKAIRY